MVRVSDLEDRVWRAAERWSLLVGEPLIGGTSSAVFEARDGAGRDLVLKLAAEGSAAEDLTGAEAAALSGWVASGAAVRLVDATTDALLLARARPGAPWPWTPPEPLDALVGVAADLLTRLWAAPPPSYRFPTLAAVYPRREQLARADAASEQLERGEPDRGVAGLRRLPTAAASAEHLISTAVDRHLLHGDFITKNIVSDATAPTGWVALDPLPMIGDPAAEVGAFAAYHPAESILPIAEAMTGALALDRPRAMRWAAVWTVHQTAQAWRDDQEQLEQLVTSREIDRLLTS
ncbi:aminoglycoside phosphotransferase family protein [Microlunatus lacustris]